MYPNWGMPFFYAIFVRKYKYKRWSNKISMVHLKSFKNFLLVIFIISFSLPSKAQSNFSWDRFVFGGNFGGGFSSQETAIALSPTVGYRFTERLVIGTGVIYQYYKLNFPPLVYKSNNYGAKLFTSYSLTESLIAHVEYEWLNLDYPSYDFTGKYIGNDRRNIGSLFVGGGYRQRFGVNSTVDIMLLYNLTETPYTPYSNPIIRVGFGIGL